MFFYKMGVSILARPHFFQMKAKQLVNKALTLLE
jgi:hypothetical protein